MNESTRNTTRTAFYLALNGALTLYTDAVNRNDVQAKRYYAVAIHALLGPSRPFISEDEEDLRTVPCEPKGEASCLHH